MEGLDYCAVAALPKQLCFERLGRSIEAVLFEHGALTVTDGTMRLADAAWVERTPALRLRIPSGSYPVYTYRWMHAGRPIEVCAVVAWRRPLLSVYRPLEVPSAVRPDLSDGVAVDSGAVAFRGANTLHVASGFGDGYYPAFEVLNLGLWRQALIVDFKAWHVKRYALMRGQMLDEYGLVVNQDGSAV